MITVFLCFPGVQMFPLYPRTPFFSLPQLYFFSFSEDTNRGLLCTLQGLPWTSPLTFGKSQEKRHALGAIWKTKRRVVGECEYFPLWKKQKRSWLCLIPWSYLQNCYFVTSYFSAQLAISFILKWLENWLEVQCDIHSCPPYMAVC